MFAGFQPIFLLPSRLFAFCLQQRNILISTCSSAPHSLVMFVSVFLLGIIAQSPKAVTDHSTSELAYKRPARHNTTMKWLLHARPGVCAPTEITQGNCHTGAKGAWALRREQSTGWHTTVNHCLRLCSSCPRCGYISVHAAEPAECNWFAECRLEKLKGNPKAANGWRSGHAGAAASSIASSAAFVASIENQAARDAPVHCDDRPHAGFRGLLYNASACSLTYPPRNLYPFRLRQLHKCGAATGWSRELLETMPLPLPEEQPSLIRRRPAACLCASCQNCQYR